MRLAWFLATALLTVAFADSLRTLGRRGRQSARRSRGRARLALGLVEVGVAAALLAVGLAPGRAWPILTGAGRGPAALLAAAGVLLAAAGALLAAWARRHLGSLFSVNFVVRHEHRLVTDGPYALVRHPIYLGVILYLAGTALVFDHRLILAGAVLSVPLFLLHIRIEEGMFASAFGPEFESYRRRVPALLPWPRPPADPSLR